MCRESVEGDASQDICLEKHAKESITCNVWVTMTYIVRGVSVHPSDSKKTILEKAVDEMYLDMDPDESYDVKLVGYEPDDEDP